MTETETETGTQSPPTEDDTATAPPVKSRYHIEFTFDSDVQCAITIYYLATEEITNGNIM